MPPNRWALLIGIDKYLPHTIANRVVFNDLQGSVNDVSKIEKYLSKIGTDPAKVTKLTASNDGTALPKEDVSIWPTHHNIVTQLQKIQDAVSQGDLVYIHYSGHGIRRSELTQQTDIGDHFTGTALAPMDVMAGGAYLTGYELGVRVKAMIEKKDVRVTIVLDSCFSGRGLRNSDGYDQITARTTSAVDKSMLPSDIAVIRIAEDLDSKNSSSYDTVDIFRTATARPSWLEDPVGCVVLSACESDQKAGVCYFDGHPGGIFTHWLLSALDRDITRPPTAAKAMDLAARSIRAMRFRNHVQTPVIHGDSFYEFFGPQIIIQRVTCSVSQVMGSDLVRLEIGRAQAVTVGAIYSVFPEEWGKEVGTSLTVPTHQIRVEKVGRFEAWASILSTSLTSCATSVMSGSRAVLQSWAFAPSAISSQGLHQRARANYEHELSKTPGIGFQSNEGPVLLAYTDTQNLLQLKLPTNSSPLAFLPKIQEDEERALERFAYITSHILRYQAIIDLRNDPSQAHLPVSFELLDMNQTPIAKTPEGHYVVHHDEEVIASFTNCSLTERLYLTILCFDSTWAVNRLHPAKGQYSELLERSETASLMLNMKIPETPQGAGTTEFASDTLRACIYTGDQPIAWDELLLPELSAVAGKDGHRQSIEASLDQQISDGGNYRKIERSKRKEIDNQHDDFGQWMFLDLSIRTYPRLH